jgi:hypothetical protein
MKALLALLLAAPACAADLSLPSQPAPLAPLGSATLTPTAAVSRELLNATAIGRIAYEMSMDAVLPAANVKEPLAARLAQTRADIALAEERGDGAAVTGILASLYKEGIRYLPPAPSFARFATTPVKGPKNAPGLIGLAFKGWKVRASTPDRTARRIAKLVAPQATKVDVDDPTALESLRIFLPSYRPQEPLERLRAHENVKRVVVDGSFHDVELKRPIYRRAAAVMMKKFGLSESWMKPKGKPLETEIFVQARVEEKKEAKVLKSLIERLAKRLSAAGLVGRATFYWRAE